MAISERMLKFEFPPEWAPHSATWLAWPDNPETWQGRLKFVQPVWIEMIKALHLHETVNLLVNNPETENGVRHRLDRADIDLKKVQFHQIPTNDCWLRDTGPTFVLRQGSGQVKSPSSVAAVCWKFNSWGEKWPPWDLDAQVSLRIAEVTRLPSFKPGIVLEGGSIEVNGEGILLTTESCLLSKKRNPNLKKEDTEQYLKDFLGIQRVVWLTGQPPVGDDTDGHIDNLARFVNRNTVVAPFTDDRSNPNFNSLMVNFKKLEELTDIKGEKLKIISLPVPKIPGPDGAFLPASYANFYIANGVVLVPAFHDPADQTALEVLTPLFPNRRLVSIYSRDLVLGFGGIHCVTQQQPI